MRCIADDKCFTIRVKVTMLDDSFRCFSLSNTTKAKRILNSLSENLKLSDAHYFGLKTLDCQGHWHWINPQKSIQPQLKQWKCQPAIEQSFQPSSNGMKSSVSNGVVDFQDRVKKPASSFRVCGLNRSRQFHPLGSSVTESQAQSTTTTNHTQPLTLTYHIYFAVRYYPFDPTLISNEQTRYQIFLQLRADLVTGQLTVDQELFVSLCGLILQSDCGDYGEERLGPFYVKQLLKMPNLSPDVEARIKAKHAEFRCRQPALVEYQLLDRVKSCVSYGQNKFSVREVVSGMHCFLGIGPIALVIEDSQLNSIRFSWFQVSGLSRKNKQLLVNITDGAEKFCYRYSFEDQQWLQEKCKLCKDYFTFYKAELTRAFCQRSMDGGALPTNGHSPSTQITQCTNIPVSSLTSLGYQSRPDMQSRANSQEFAAQQPISRYTIESEMCYSQYPRAIASPTHEPQAYHLVRQIPEASVDYCSPPLPAIPVHCSAPMSTQQNWTGGRAQSNGEWPPNPYHVPPAGVFYRPRGCQTMTEFNDGQSTIFCSTRTDPVSRPHTRRSQGLVLDHRRSLSRHDTEPPHRVRGHRRSFPRTKYYVIDEVPRVPDPQNTNNEQWITHSGDSNMIKYYRPPHSTTSGERETGYVYEQAPICAQADEVDIRPARCLPNPIAHASRLAHESGDMLATYGVHQGQLFSVSTGHDIHDPREQTRIRKVPPTRQMVSRGSAYCVDVDDNNIDGCTPGLVAGYTIGDQMDETTNRIRMRPVHPGRVSPVFGSPACRPNVRSRLDHVNHCSSNSRSLITNPSSNGTRITLDDVLDFRGSYSARVPPVIPVKHPSDQGAESPAPSLLCSSNPTTNTNTTSELCESLCASLSRFRLPPSPLLDETSPAAREPPPFRSGRDLDSGDLYPESNLPSPPSQSFLNSLHKLPQSSQPDRFVAAQSRWDPVTSRKDWSIGLSDLSNSRCSRVRRLPLTPPERYPTLINPDSSSVINNHTKDESGFPKDCVTSTHSPRDNMNTSVYTRKTLSPSMSAYDVHLIDRSDSVISGDRI